MYTLNFHIKLMKQLLVSCEILSYLGFCDQVQLVRMCNVHTLDDFIELCKICNGDLFKYFSFKTRTNIDYLTHVIKTSIQGQTLLRYVPHSVCIKYWSNTYGNVDTMNHYMSGLSYVTKHKGRVPDTYVHLMKHVDFAFVALRVDGCRLKQLDFHERCNIFLVKTAISQNGNALMYASRTLKNNINVVMECVNKFPYALEYVGHDCITNKNVLHVATSKVKWVKRFYSNKLRKVDV